MFFEFLFLLAELWERSRGGEGGGEFRGKEKEVGGRGMKREDDCGVISQWVRE